MMDKPLKGVMCSISCLQSETKESRKRIQRIESVFKSEAHQVISLLQSQNRILQGYPILVTLTVTLKTNQKWLEKENVCLIAMHAAMISRVMIANLLYHLSIGSKCLLTYSQSCPLMNSTHMSFKVTQFMKVNILFELNNFRLVPSSQYM